MVFSVQFMCHLVGNTYLLTTVFMLRGWLLVVLAFLHGFIKGYESKLGDKQGSARSKQLTDQ